MRETPLAEAAVLPAFPSLRSTATVRRSLRALGWTIALTLLFTAWHVVEKWGLSLGKHDRLVRSPALVPMVALGVPHFLIAALFAATSPRRATASARGLLLGLLLLGAALAWGYGAFGAHVPRHKLPVAAVGLLFVVHQLRDEGWLFVASGDGPQGVAPERVRAFVDAWTTCLLLALGAVYVLGFQAYNASKGRLGPVDLVAPGIPYAAQVVVLGGVAAAAIAWRWRAQGRADPDGPSVWLGRIAPLLAVHGLFLGVVLAGTVARTLLEALVLWHVLSWLLFALERIDAQPAGTAPPRGWLDRAKRTRAGFLALHLGLAAAVFAAMLVWTYAQGKSPGSPLRVVADPTIFYYWTILHVVTSLGPR